MDAMQIVIPVVGIIAAAAVTFYAVSFSEIREKTFRQLDEDDARDGYGFKSSMSSRERRAKKKADKRSNT
ncbi:uncharacterized protein LOC141643634 [Silene latifolia]|uniref:uncharacterized protein LOC141643634 n=1 Tax=Silene latifolia TaxID=37657 RepID=UPI003D770854